MRLHAIVFLSPRSFLLDQFVFFWNGSSVPYCVQSLFQLTGIAFIIERIEVGSYVKRNVPFLLDFSTVDGQGRGQIHSHKPTGVLHIFFSCSSIQKLTFTLCAMISAFDIFEVC